MSTTARPSRLLFSLLFASLFASACDDQVAEEFPLLEVNPASVTIAGSQVGVETRVPIELRNAGGSTLVVTELGLSNELDPNEFRIEHGVLPLRLAGQETAIVDLFYTPGDPGEDEGFLLVTSNSADGQETVVPINTTDLRAELIVDPPRLEFASDDGMAQERTTRVVGLGGVPVRITEIALADGTDEEFELVTPNADLPTIGRGDEFSITVRYTPVGGDTDVGDLLVFTDPPVVLAGSAEPTDRIRVPLNATQPSPEIDVVPGQVNFGAIDLNTESDIVEIVVQNLGSAPLLIESIGLAPATPPPNNEQFKLHDLPDFAEPMVIEAEGLARFGVSYAPMVDGSHATAIVIESNDESESILTIPLNGRVRQPCIQVLPGSLDFGIVALNIESAPANLQIANCGDLELTVDQIVIDDPDFQWAPADPMMGREDVVLPPLGSMPVRVWYTNNGLGEGQRKVATLTVANSTVETPEIDVPLVVIGGGAPTCELRILPRRMDFGLVARGRNVSRDLILINTGTGHCELTQQEIVPIIEIPIPGFNEVRFVLTGPAPVGRIGPGAEVPIEVTYRPQVFAADSALLKVNYDNPFTGDQNIEVAAELSGVSGDSNIEVIPGSLDFGRVTAGECASIEERVAVYNTGIVNLCITDLFLEGPDCDEFLIVDRPRADQDGCIIVTRNNPAEVILVYEPTDLGPDQCNLVFESDANDNPELRVPLDGEGTRDRRQTDVFEQTSGRTVDVLFVVDNSGSMGEEQDSLQDNFRDFIAGAAQFANDYQLGIVTTDMDQDDHQGRLQGNPRIMRRGPGVEQDFEDTVEVGTNGAGEEKGLAAAQSALSDPLAFDTGVACALDAECIAPDTCIEGFCGGFNRGFLREEAALEIIFVSDEDDFSTASLNFYVDFFKNIKGFRNESQFHAHAIVGVENGRARPCDGRGGAADAGSRYVEVANRTNGELFSICDDNFGPPLRELGNQAFGLPVQFFLSRPAIRNTVQVSVEGMRRNDGWDFDDPSNSVVFDEATVPQPGETIQVDYEAQCFERRGG